MAGKILFVVLRCGLRVKFPKAKTTAKAISSLGRLGALWMVPVKCWATFLFLCVVTRTVKKFFPLRLPRKDVGSPSLEIFKNHFWDDPA